MSDELMTGNPEVIVDSARKVMPRFRELRLYSSCKGLLAKVEVVAKGNQ
jgi:hypothetical protein